MGLRQVVMALMNWAIDVPQKLLQNDARLFPKMIIKYIIERFINHYLFYIKHNFISNKKINI